MMFAILLLTGNFVECICKQEVTQAGKPNLQVNSMEAANMCITEERLVEEYRKGNPHERFLLIYKNYSVFPQLVVCFETGLFNKILFEVEYNRRAKNNDDLGVRIQTSRRSDPTATQAIEHIMIREAVEECNFSGDILSETDDPEKHKLDILTIHMMRREFEVFDTALRALPPKEYGIVYSYIHKDRKILEIAEDRELAYQSVKNLIGVTRRMLESSIVPYFRETL